MDQPVLWPFAFYRLAETTDADSSNSEPAQDPDGSSSPMRDEVVAGDDQMAQSPPQTVEEPIDPEAIVDPKDKPSQDGRLQIKSIGYGSPPIAHQWQKSQSGNPRGRPKENKGTSAAELAGSRMLSIVRREFNRKSPQIIRISRSRSECLRE